MFAGRLSSSEKFVNGGVETVLPRWELSFSGGIQDDHFIRRWEAMERGAM